MEWFGHWIIVMNVCQNNTPLGISSTISSKYISKCGYYNAWLYFVVSPVDLINERHLLSWWLLIQMRLFKRVFKRACFWSCAAFHMAFGYDNDNNAKDIIISMISIAIIYNKNNKNPEITILMMTIGKITIRRWGFCRGYSIHISDIIVHWPFKYTSHTYEATVWQRMN